MNLKKIQDQRVPKPIRLLGYFLLLLSIPVVYYVHVLFVFSADDLYYSTNLVTGEPLRNIGDIIQSQIWHYFHWGGRSVAHFLLQTTLLLGETYANITNMICIFILIFLILHLAGFQWSLKKRIFYPLWALLLVSGFLILLNPNWSQTLFWESGFANYIYTQIFILTFLSPFFKLLQEKEVHFPLMWVWMPFLGLLAGWSNENTGSAVFATVFFILIYFKIKNRPIPLWSVLGTVFCFLGALLVIISPGNMERIDYNYSDINYGWKMKIFLRFYHLGVSVYEYLLSGILLLLVVFLLYYIIKKTIEPSLLGFLSIFVLSIGAMILSPHYPSRATFGSLVMILVMLLWMFRKILESYKHMTWILTLISIFIFTGMLFIMVEYIMNYKELIPYA